MKFFIGLGALFILPGTAVAGYQALIWLFSPSAPLYFWLGVVAGIVGYLVLLRKIMGLETFEHELTHAVVALLFFRRITGFKATRHRGGSITHFGSFGGSVADHLIGLAPYYLPTFTLILACSRPFIPATSVWAADLAIGFTLVYHLCSTAGELRNNWTKEHFTTVDGKWTKTDIGRRGFLFSGLLIVTLALALHGLIFWVMRYGYFGVRLWGRIIWSTDLLVYRPLAIKAWNLLLRIPPLMQHAFG